MDADRTFDRIIDIGELEQCTIPHQFDDAAPVFINSGIDYCGTKLFERSQSFANETAVTDHVGGQYGSKSALNPLFGHTDSPSTTRIGQKIMVAEQ